MDFIQITPLEHVELNEENTNFLTVNDDVKDYAVGNQHGMNKRMESPGINNTVRKCYQNYQNNNRSSRLHQLVCARRKNPNGKGIMVQS